MTLRISQFVVMCGLSMVALSGVAFAQAPRYQSPLSLPASPQPQMSLPMPAAITPNGTVVEDVIVHVNDQIISRSDLERAVQQLAQEAQQSNASPAEVADRQKTLLRDMIDQQLLLSRAKELNLNVDAEVIRRLDDIRKQNHMETMDDLERAARAQGVSYEDFKAQIRNQLLTQQVVRDEVGRRLQMTQSQEQAYYEAHKQEFAQPEQIRLSEILIPTAADANDAAVAQAQAKADQVAAKVKAGDKFEDLAKTYSGGQTAAQGGDLGMYKRGALAKVLEDQTFDLKAGESTAPIRTRQGFVILKVTEHAAAGIPALKDVESQVQEAMYTEQMQPALRAYLTKLREDSYVEIAQGYSDSGATSKQTKYLFTAYAPPVVKKKKVEQKQRFDRGGRYSAVNKSAKTPAAETGSTTAAMGTTATAAATATTGTTAATATTGTTVATATTGTTATAGTTATTGKTTKAKASSKPKKIKREKIRFGQAPRNSLPAGPQETAVGGDIGAGASSAAVPPDGTIAGARPGAASGAAPGTAIAPLEGVDMASTSTTNEDPLAPKPVDVKKTRFSDRAKTEKVVKAKTQATKAKEKALATPAPADAEEKATQQAQASPLGLNGDTTKKKKKVKVKGAPKERLQNKPPAPAAPPPEETPAKAPDRGTPLEGTAGAGKTAPAPSTNTTPAPAPHDSPPPPPTPNPQ
jgi:peptidyl-prolyl cis-trans isomerase SurA